MDFLVRIASLVRKELLAVLRDKKSRLALIIPPIIQIAIFGYAATMNVTRVPYAVLDKDGGEAASQYIADLEGTGIFQRQATAATEKDIDRMIDNREIVVGLTIPPDFSRNIQTGGPPPSSSLRTGATRTRRPSPSATASKSPPPTGRLCSPKTAYPPRWK